jgi:hypothetical protein
MSDAVARSREYHLGALRSEVSRLNAYFAGHAEILAFPSSITLAADGDYPRTIEENVEWEIQLPTIPKGRNEGHGLLTSRIGADEEHVTLRYQRTDFATVRAKRVLAKRYPAEARDSRQPAVLSASAVVVSPSDNRLVLHERSHQSDTYPGARHTFGGAFQPPLGEATGGPLFDSSLAYTFRREFLEESQIFLRPFREQDALVALAREPKTGFVQCLYLGLQVDMVDDNRACWEGDIRIVSFDELEATLAAWEDWVPTGRMHVMAWLAAGAPGATVAPGRARAVYDAVVQAAPRHRAP